MTWLVAILYKLIWWIFVQGPLCVISAFSNIINYIGGSLVLKLIFGINPDFTFAGLPAAFYGMIIIGVVVGVVLFITNICLMYYTGKDEEFKTKLLSSVKLTFFAILLIFFVPFLILLFGLFLNGIGMLIPGLFSISGEGSVCQNLADQLYYIGSASSILSKPPSNYSVPDNITDYNIFVEVIGVWFVMFNMVLVGIQIVLKAIEIFTLFIFSPIVAFSSVTDNGARIIIFKNMILSKYLVVIFDIIGFSITIYAINTLYQLVLEIEGTSWLEKQILGLLVVGGGSSIMLSISSLAAQFIGQESGLKDVKSTLAAAGGVALGGMAFASNMTKGILGNSDVKGLGGGIGKLFNFGGKSLGGDVAGSKLKNSRVGLFAQRLSTGAIGKSKKEAFIQQRFHQLTEDKRNKKFFTKDQERGLSKLSARNKIAEIRKQTKIDLKAAGLKSSGTGIRSGMKNLKKQKYADIDKKLEKQSRKDKK